MRLPFSNSLKVKNTSEEVSSNILVANQNSSASDHNFNRIITNKVTEKDFIISIGANLAQNFEGYSGRFTRGFVINTATEDNVNEFNSKNKATLNNKYAANSLFVLDILGLDNQVLSSIPISVPNANTASGDDVIGETYDKPGSYDDVILLPKNTNSIRIRTRKGQTLDRIYNEDVAPALENIVWPTTVSTDKVSSISFDILPKEKYFYYTVWLTKSNGESLGIVSHYLTNPVSGFQKVDFNFDGYNLNVPVKFKIQVSTPFQIIEYESPNIDVLSNSVPVLISGYSDTTYKSFSAVSKDLVFNVNDEFKIGWDHLFYGYDVTNGIDHMCKKEKRCFELTWEGSGVKFNKSFYFNNYDIEEFPMKIVTKSRNLNCVIGGSGAQFVKLTIKENGNVIGSSTLDFNVTNPENLENKISTTVCNLPYGYDSSVD